jgi:hypothetical protein
MLERKMYRRISEILVLFLWLAIAFLIFQKTQNKTEDVVQSPIIEKTQERIQVKKITVIDGSSYDLVLNDIKYNRVLCNLPVKSTAEAKNKIINMLNESSNPYVVLKTKAGDRWLVELFFTYEGREYSMSEWLDSNKMIYK